MNYGDARVLTEECPLTKNVSNKCEFPTCCRGGLKFIISSFVTLTIAITVTLILQILYSDNNTQSNNIGIHGAVATDYTNCSQIGTKILRKNGNAVDAAVAATLCMTVVAPHKTGLGGGGYIMIYDHKEHSDPLIIDFASNTIKGAWAAEEKRIPAVLRGLELAQNRYGNLPWYEVVEPSVKLARDGFVVSKEFAYEISKNINYRVPYGVLNAGDILQLHNLADTLYNVGRYGSDVFYNGTLSHTIMWDESKRKDIEEELANYQPQFGLAEKFSFYGYAVYFPSHVLSLNSSLNAIQELRIPYENSSTIESQIRVAETLILSNTASDLIQNAQQQRYTGVMAMDWQDKYVSVITGLSAPLGFKHMVDAGFLLDVGNDGNDFPSFLPIIFHNKKSKCGLRGVFGTDDPVLGAQLLYNLIVRTQDISMAIEYPRYYILPDGIAIENDQEHLVANQLHTQLSSITSISHTDAGSILKSVNGIIKWKDLLTSHSDSRGGGLASRF